MRKKKNPTTLTELMKAMQKPKKKGKMRKWKPKHYPTELVGLSGWAEMIEAIKKRRGDKNG